MAAAAAVAAPHLWIPRDVHATLAFGTVKHVLYIRLSGGFRFPTAFNGALPERFNPFGLASGVASGTEWGVGAILGDNSWLTDDLAAIGLQPVPAFTNDMAVLTCVDHEPLSGAADGNHNTGLERFLTGYVGGTTGLFTMVNYGLRERTAAEVMDGIVNLPAIVMGDVAMSRGAGEFGAFRPAVLRAGDLERFTRGAAEQLPEWARTLAEGRDARLAAEVNPVHFPSIDAYAQSREATKVYSDIFTSDALKVGQAGGEAIDGLTNEQLAAAFGDTGAGRDVHLALRLFHFGSPAVYIDQGSYDFHSDEVTALPMAILELSRTLSALHWALKTMQHPSGGTYWDHTLVMIGSEFSRTSGGAPFNSGQGSDHNGDFATRFMSMPFMGGSIAARGRQIGRTSADEMRPEAEVFSYRAMWKTVLDTLGADHSTFFPADEPFDDLFLGA